LTLDLHCNLQFSVAASSRRICDVFSVNLRLQFPFNNNNNNRSRDHSIAHMPFHIRRLLEPSLYRALFRHDIVELFQQNV